MQPENEEVKVYPKKSVECPECQHKQMVDDVDEISTCENCGAQWMMVGGIVTITGHVDVPGNGG
jgi:ribosomal protein S27E